MIEMGLNAAQNDTVMVSIEWNGMVHMSTHGDAHRYCGMEFEGDGIKKLVIKLSNNSGIAETIGGYYIYREMKDKTWEI